MQHVAKISSKEGELMEIRRDFYLDKLIKRKHNGLIKIITGIRRCGKSYLLNTIFYQHLLSCGIDDAHIIRFAFDSADDLQKIGESLIAMGKEKRGVNPEKFMAYVNSRLADEDMYYLLLDEMHMYPLSFAEFMSVYPGDKYMGLAEYMLYGGIPVVVLREGTAEKAAALQNLLSEIYLSDIYKRNRIRNKGEMEDLLNILASAIGSLTNYEKLKNTFKSVKKSKITSTTIKKYLDCLEDSFLIEAASRYDVKGKAYIDTPKKYYFSDLGLRNARINFRQFEQTHSMENVIYNELCMRGYSVDVGVVPIAVRDDSGNVVRKQLEVDFVCNMGSVRYYIQSAYSLPDEMKRAQEVRPLKNIDDTFKKIIITKDIVPPYYDEYGILTVNIYDFLLDSDSLGK